MPFVGDHCLAPKKHERREGYLRAFRVSYSQRDVRRSWLRCISEHQRQEDEVPRPLCHRDGEGLRCGQPTAVGHAQDDRMLTHVGVGRRAGERRRAVAVVGQGEPSGFRLRGDRERVAVVILSTLLMIGSLRRYGR